VAVRWSRQPLPVRDHDLKGRDRTGRVVPVEQEMDRERSEMDGFVGRIDPEVDGLLCHVCVPLILNPEVRLQARDKA